MALNHDKIGQPIGPLEKQYNWKDIALYGIGVGAGFKDLSYVYENGMKVLPSYSIGSVFEFLMESAIASDASLMGILHGEQDIIFHNPIPVEGTLTTLGKITNYYDRGENKGALVVAEAETKHSNGDLLFTNIFTLFSRFDGGFGGEAPPKDDVVFPDSAPDITVDDHPSVDQPLVYRLSGDIFGLHVDPEFAQAMGFEKPIMHGLCTHGYACRHLTNELLGGEPKLMKRFRTRFSKPLYPGVPIQTQAWKVEPGKALFKVVNKETGQVVIDKGICEYEEP